MLQVMNSLLSRVSRRKYWAMCALVRMMPRGSMKTPLPESASMPPFKVQKMFTVALRASVLSSVAGRGVGAKGTGFFSSLFSAVFCGGKESSVTRASSGGGASFSVSPRRSASGIPSFIYETMSGGSTLSREGRASSVGGSFQKVGMYPASRVTANNARKIPRSAPSALGKKEVMRRVYQVFCFLRTPQNASQEKHLDSKTCPCIIDKHDLLCSGCVLSLQVV